NFKFAEKCQELNFLRFSAVGPHPWEMSGRTNHCSLFVRGLEQRSNVLPVGRIPAGQKDFSFGRSLAHRSKSTERKSATPEALRCERVGATGLFVNQKCQKQKNIKPVLRKTRS